MARAANTAAEAVGKLLGLVKALDETMGGMAAGAAEAAAAEETLASAEESVGKAAAAAGAGTAAAASAERDLAASAGAAAAAENAVADATAAAARAASEAAFAESAVAFADAEAARAALELAVAQKALAESSDGAGAAATRAAIGFRLWGFGLGLTRNALHWVVAGSAEFLAVAIPAFVAAGAAAAVMAQGAQNAYVHLSAVYAATEATANVFHQTAGQYLGLGDALQKAQNAANPHVYELLGAGLNIAKTAAGGFVSEGTQVVGVLDNFAAKVTAEMQGALGSQLHSLLAGGVRDLTQFGQVLGNVGHAVINLAGDMPGLAHVLLDIVDGASRLLLAFSGLPAIIITGAMAFEEFNRWGSLVVSMLARLVGGTAELQGGFFTLTRFGSVIQNLASGVMIGAGKVTTAVGDWVASLGNLAVGFGVVDGEMAAFDAQTVAVGTAVAATGAEISGFGKAMVTTAGEITVAEAAFGVGFVAAMVGLIAVTHNVQGATQAWISSINQAVASANNMKVLGTIASELTAVTGRQAETQKALNNVYSGAQPVVGAYARAVGDAQQRVTAFQNEQQHLSTSLNNVMAGIGFLSRTYGTTFVGALELANQAGVHLSQGITGTGVAATDARVKIANYVAGLEAMGATTSTVGHDVTLLGIQSALASSHVQQLQQAFSSFVTNMTGGTSNLAALNESIRNIGSVSQSSAGQLGQFGGTIKLTTGQAASALRSFGAVGSQVWQNFDSALSGSASQLVQWFQLAGTEGAITGPQFAKGVMDIVASFQQVASKSPAARAQLVGFANAAGMNVSSWSDLTRQLHAAGASASGLPGIISAVTGKMANMNSVARALGSSLGTSVIASMNNARVAASNLGQSAQTLSAAWMRTHSVNASVATGFRQTYTALQDVYHNTTMSRNAVNALGQQLGMTKGQIAGLDVAVGIGATHLSTFSSNADKAKTSVQGAGAAAKTAATNTGDLATAVDKTRTPLMDTAVAAKSASLNAQQLGTQAHTAGTAAQGLSSNAQQATTQVKNLGTAANTTRGNLGTVNNEIRNTATYAGNSAGPLSAMASNISRVGSSAGAAAGQVHALASAIASLQSKTIYVTTVMQTQHRAGGGPVAAGMPYIVGEQGQEMFVPSQNGIIIPAPETKQIMAGQPSSRQGGGSQANSPQAINLTTEHHAHLYLDGKQILTSVQTEGSRWIRRNRGQNDGIWVPT